MKRFFYKILKFVVIFILILVAIYISFGFISGGFKATITRSVSIDARPLAVWSVLTDFEKYPDWNPFLRISGTQYQAGKKNPGNSFGFTRQRKRNFFTKTFNIFLSGCYYLEGQLAVRQHF